MKTSSNGVMDREASTLAQIEPMQMRPDAIFAEAGRGVLLGYLKKLRKYLPEAVAGDTEAVHNARVATRRLRAGLKVMEETVYEPEKIEKFRRKLRKIANSLSESRDSDVLLEHLDKYIASLPGEKLLGLDTFRQNIADKGEAEQRHMHKALDEKKTEKLLGKLEDFLSNSVGNLRHLTSSQNEAAPTLVRHFSGSIIWRRYEEVLAYETRLPAPPAVLHRLRVACKHLRYTLEFFQDGLPGPSKALVQQITEAQDYLGKLQDHQVALEKIEQLEKDQPENAALQEYGKTREAERDQLLTNFTSGIWPNLNGADFRHKLATALAGEVANVPTLAPVPAPVKTKANRPPKEPNLN